MGALAAIPASAGRLIRCSCSRPWSFGWRNPFASLRVNSGIGIRPIVEQVAVVVSCVIDGVHACQAIGIIVHILVRFVVSLLGK